MRNILSILFIHSRTRPYRLPLFKALIQKYNIFFLFTHGNKKEECKNFMSDWNYKVLKKLPIFGYKGGINPGLILELIKKRHQYQIILASDIASFPAQMSFIMSRILRKKYIVFSEIWQLPNTFLGKIIYPFIKHIAKRSDACIAAGTKSKEFYLKAGAKPKNVFIAPNISLDLSLKPISNEKLATIKKRVNPENKKIILYLGRILKIKNLDALIKAFSKLENKVDNVKLLIIGSGPFENYCYDLSNKLAVRNIQFLPKITFDDTIYYFKLCHLFVLPGRIMKKSNPNVESWGMTLNEAMSLAKPIISTTSVGGSYDLIKNMKNGIQVEQNNPEELYQAIKKILADNQLIERMGQESRKIIKNNFNTDQQTKNFFKAINSVIPE